MRKILNGSGERRVTFGAPNGGDVAAPRGSAITVGDLLHQKSSPWTISCPSPGAAGASKTTSRLPVKNVTMQKSSFFPWNGNNT